MRLHIAVHDALAMAEVKGLEQFVDVVPHINVVEFGVEAAEVRVVYVFEDERGGFALPREDRSGLRAVPPRGKTGSGTHLRVPNHIKKRDDIRPAG